MKIIVIAPAGFHLGYLGCYGNPWVDTSCLDSLAAEGIVFDQHISDSPSAKGAWRAWRTGRYGFPLSSSKDPHDSFDMLATLRDRGIPSVLITGSERTRPDIETVWGKIHAISGNKDASFQEKLWQSAAETVRQLISKDRALVWIETNVLIPPWSFEESNGDYFSAEPDEDSDEPIEPLLNPTPGLLHSADETTFLRLQRTYAAVVRQFDGQLGEFLQGLQNDLYESWMIIVTTDRGFPLAEHGLVGYTRPWLHEELLHIPLLIRLPSAIKGGARIGALTQPVDLMSTLLEALELTPVGGQGSSLLRLIRGEQERIREFACSGLEIGGEVEISLRTADWAFLVPQDTGSGSERPLLRERQLYVKPEDRWEVNNVLQHHLEFADQLEQALRAFVNAPFCQAHGSPSASLESVKPTP